MRPEEFEVDVHGKFNVYPTCMEDGSVGYDIALPEDEGDLVMPYNSRRDINTGIVIKPPIKCFTLIVPRSNSYKRDVRISNTVGVIDPSYCGQDDEIIVSLTRDNKKDVYLGNLEYPETRNHGSEDLLKHCREEYDREFIGFPFFQSDGERAYHPALTSDKSHERCYGIGDNTGRIHFYGIVETRLTVYEQGERFCQALFLPYYKPELLKKKLEEFSEDARGGFGSTGMK